MDKAMPVLEKEKVMRDIAKYLMKNPKTDTNAMRYVIYNELREEGIIGRVTDRKYGGTSAYDKIVSDEDALLINECIYDLLYSRVITPGVNAHELSLPFIHVSDVEKLKEYL
ncbi:hypothetical protein BGM26_07130 [Bacillus sp. FJAT-29790]|uniref:hypothetical protein n=1 Tax=Bacillus sp. FJAT-29790 TaxID=1895002 RepID=UPI001C244ADA|nr:hypothetical protein [Bacillus sp. FJAT-29790]MBU8878763.1 hypothetical protein [Bacillus sp. FJAT-29790]